MPTITTTVTTTVCTTCGKKSCTGERWEFIAITEYPGDYFFKGTGKVVDLTTLPQGSWFPVMCTGRSGRAKFLKGKKVGDEVTLNYQNMATPSICVVRKIED